VTSRHKTRVRPTKRKKKPHSTKVRDLKQIIGLLKLALARF